MKFLVLPIAAYADFTESLSEAIDKAKKSASEFESDFVVLEVEWVGGYERVSPIQMINDPTDTPPITVAAIDNDGNNPTFENPSRVK